jgi:hypothetical protein
MEHYDPAKDKYLHNFFEKQIRQRMVSENYKGRQSTKTLPAEGRQDRAKVNRPHKLTTMHSEMCYKEQGVGEISKQEFSSYMKMMRDKLLKR